MLKLDLEDIKNPEEKAYHYAWMGKMHMENRNFKKAWASFVVTLNLWEEQKFKPQLYFNVPSYVREIMFHTGTYETYRLGTEMQRVQWGYPQEELDHQLNNIKMSRYDIIQNTPETLKKARWSLSRNLYDDIDYAFGIPVTVEQYDLRFTETVVLLIPILDDDYVNMKKEKLIDVFFKCFFTSLHMLESIHQVFQKYTTHDIHFDNFMRCLMTDEIS